MEWEKKEPKPKRDRKSPNMLGFGPRMRAVKAIDDLVREGKTFDTREALAQYLEDRVGCEFTVGNVKGLFAGDHMVDYEWLECDVITSVRPPALNDRRKTIEDRLACLESQLLTISTIILRWDQVRIEGLGVLNQTPPTDCDE